MAVKSFRQNALNKFVLNTLFLGLSTNVLWAEPPERLILAKSTSLLKTASALGNSETSRLADASEVETIRERFKNGKVRIEKIVLLTPEGDFVPHGSFTEWNEKGELVQTGAFQNGKRQGTWIKIYSASQTKLFDGFPYNKFKAPFQSTAEFTDGELNGVWSITDAHGRVVMHLALENGLRNGHAVWNLPSGTPAFEADYENGVINGQLVERNAAGAVVKQLDYLNGSVRTIDRETYPNKRPKSEIQVLSGAAKLVSKDNFETLTLATYEPNGAAIRDGEFVHYFDNGAIQSRGIYSRGELDGNFEQWHSNGERACVGTFENGKQIGKWTWWHPNGMRKSSGQFDDAKLQGEMMAWDENGKRISSRSSEPILEMAEHKLPSQSRRR